MALNAGQRLGPYEVLSAVGAGGMGEVYRARDTRLGRVVAIKVLGARLANDPDVRERFEREARAVAALHHPNICVLYDVGHEGAIEYLVIEYLEGDTLAERLSRGPLPATQALEIAAQVADALDAAHRQGITHRDLKPANIMLTKSGAKLLDFGVAKLSASTAGDATMLPTVGLTTSSGLLVGTIHYMAPEQLDGKPADARTDIYALGAVVHEMLSGKRAFDGIVPLTSPALDRVVNRCLAKNPDDRWQSARDLAAELRWIAEGETSAATPPAASASRLRMVLLVGSSLVAGAVVAGLAVRMLMPNVTSATGAGAATTRMVITLPAGDTFPPDQNQGSTQIALSPAGDELAYVAQHAGVTQLFLRAMNSLDAHPLPGTTGASNPVFSPDGQSIAFFADGN